MHSHSRIQLIPNHVASSVLYNALSYFKNQVLKVKRSKQGLFGYLVGVGLPVSELVVLIRWRGEVTAVVVDIVEVVIVAVVG